MSNLLMYGLAFVACGGLVGVADAAYVIRLKNGNEYVTTRYWHEGSQVLFDTYGGIFGIDKSFVTKIDATERVVKLATASDHDPSEKTQTESSKEEKEQAKKKTGEESKMKKEKAPDDPIAGELSRLKEKSKQVDGMLTDEIRQLLKEITAFKNKIVKDSKLFVDYGREFNDLNKIGDTVEAALRSRTQ